MTINQELIERIKDLQEFCELHGYPLSEVLEEELTYYNNSLQYTKRIRRLIDNISVTNKIYNYDNQNSKKLQKRNLQ